MMSTLDEDMMIKTLCDINDIKNIKKMCITNKQLSKICKSPIVMRHIETLRLQYYQKGVCRFICVK